MQDIFQHTAVTTQALTILANLPPETLSHIERQLQAAELRLKAAQIEVEILKELVELEQ